MALHVTRNPAQDAREVLASYWPEKDGQPLLPVDPYEIARAMGLKVFNASLDAGTAGMLVKRAGQDPEIFLNPTDVEYRQRFTCAHELGHYVTHAGNDQQEWEYVDRRDAASSTGTRSQEVYANQFAAALLMPARLVHELSRNMDRIALAAHFDVSQEAMDFRLANLGH